MQILKKLPPTVHFSQEHDCQDVYFRLRRKICVFFLSIRYTWRYMYWPAGGTGGVPVLKTSEHPLHMAILACRRCTRQCTSAQCFRFLKILTIIFKNTYFQFFFSKKRSKVRDFFNYHFLQNFQTLLFFQFGMASSSLRLFQDFSYANKLYFDDCVQSSPRIPRCQIDNSLQIADFGFTHSITFKLISEHHY